MPSSPIDQRHSPPSGTTYDAYGARSDASTPVRTAYAGALRESYTGWYVLGNRPYGPSLRRFLAPDKLSPFHEGGLNRYAYCNGDPINRVDPTGEAWQTWALALSAAGAPDPESKLTTGAHGPGVLPHAPASFTPGTMISSVVSTIETSSVAAAIGSAATTAAHAPRSLVLGWVAHGAEAATNGQAISMSGGHDPRHHFVGQRGLAVRGGAGGTFKRHVDVINVATQPQSTKLGTTRRGNRYLRLDWYPVPHAGNANSIVMAADTIITVRSLRQAFRDLAALGHRAATLYTGMHGYEKGDNYNLDGTVRASENSFFAQDLVAARAYARDSGIKLSVVNVNELGRGTESIKQIMLEKLSRDGVHVIGCCFGMADEVVMEATGRANATVYRFYIPKPPPSP